MDLEDLVALMSVCMLLLLFCCHDVCVNVHI